MTSKKTKRHDVPTVKRNIRKVNRYKLKCTQFKRKTDLLPLAENSYYTLKQVIKELKKMNKRLSNLESNLEEPEEIWEEIPT